MTNNISLRYCEDYNLDNIRASLQKCFADLGGITNFVQPKSKVLLNCNLHTATNPNEAKTTHPNLVTILAEMLEKAGADCVIAGFPDNHNTNIQKVYETTGMLDASNNGNAQLNTNLEVFKINFDGVETKELTLIDAYREADMVINIPKLVVDSTIHGALDAYFNLQPAETRIMANKKLFDLTSLYNYQADLYFALKDKIKLTIVDAIVAREACESQRILNAIIMGVNPVHIDNCIYTILNKNFIDSVEYQVACKRNIIQNDKVNILGDNIEKFIKLNFSCSQNAISEHIPSHKETRKAVKKYKHYLARPKIIVKQCKGCEVCTKICPNKAISIKLDENEEKYACISQNKCINCFRCVHSCPYTAIKVLTPFKYKQLNNKLNKRLSSKTNN